MKKLLLLYVVFFNILDADMARLFNIERYDGVNPAVLTQLEDEGVLAVFELKIDNFSESYYATETSKIDTRQVKASFYEVEGDWVYYATLQEAVSGTQSDPRNAAIDEIGIFIENLAISLSRIINRNISLGLSYELERYGTYDKAGNTFLTGRENLWLAQRHQRFYSGITYELDEEVFGVIAGVNTFHSNHTTFGWRFFGGAGLTSYRLSDLSVELSTTLYPRQYTVGDTLASNFMPLYWNNQLQVQTDLDSFTVSMIINYDIEESLEGLVVGLGITNKIINRYEIQVKKSIKSTQDFLFFAAIENSIQDNQEDSRFIAGVAISLNFD